MAFPEDLSVFFDPDGGFAVRGTLAGLPVVGIYDDSTATTGFGALANSSAFMLASASVPAGSTGATLVIPQGTYKVRSIESSAPDITQLWLELP